MNPAPDQLVTTGAHRKRQYRRGGTRVDNTSRELQGSHQDQGGRPNTSRHRNGTGQATQGPVTPVRPVAAAVGQGQDHDHSGGAAMGMAQSGAGDAGPVIGGWGPTPPPPQLSIPQSLGPGATSTAAANGAPHFAHAQQPALFVPYTTAGVGPNSNHAPLPATPAHMVYPHPHHHPHAHIPAHAVHPHPVMPPASTGHRIGAHMHDLTLVSPFSSPLHAPPPTNLPASPAHYYSPTPAPPSIASHFTYPGPYAWPAAPGHLSPSHSSPHVVQYASPPPPAAFLAHQHNLHRSPASPSQRAGSPRSTPAYSPRGKTTQRERGTPAAPTPTSNGNVGGRMSGSGRGGAAAGNRSGGSGRRFHSHQQQQLQLQQQLGPPVPFRLPGAAGAGQGRQSPRSPAAGGPGPSPMQVVQQLPPSPTPHRHNQRHSQPHPAPRSPHAPHPAAVAQTPQSPQSPPPSSLPSSPTSPTPKDLPRLGSTPVSANRRLAQRQKQIDYGKNTLGYQNYVSAVPKSKRKRTDPVTPDKAAECSARSWAAQIKKWRRELHQWDNSANGSAAADSRSPPDSPSLSPPPVHPTRYPDQLSDIDNDSTPSSPTSSGANSPTLAALTTGRRRHSRSRHRHSTDAIPPPPLSSSPPSEFHRHSPPDSSLMHSWPARAHSPAPRASASSGTSSPPPRSETAWSVADSIAESWGTEQEEAVRRVLTLSQAQEGEGVGGESGQRTAGTPRGVVFQDDPGAPASPDAQPTASCASASAASAAATADDLPPYLTPQGYMHYYPPFMLSSSIAGGLPLFRRPRRASDASTTSHGTARSGGRAAAAGRAGGAGGGGAAAGTEYSVSDSEMSVRDDIYATEYEWAWER